MRRIGLIARHTLGEALRLKLSLLLVLVGAALVLAALALREFNFGSAELKFIGDFGFGALGFLDCCWRRWPRRSCFSGNWPAGRSTAC